MLIMRGPLALSHFRLERLLTKINDIVPQVNTLSAEFVHFIDLEEGLTKPENSVLSNLLNYGTYDSSSPTPMSISMIPEKTDRTLILVVPKSGSISPWSRKATDIAHHCNLKKIRRIERGIAYSIETSERLTWGDEQAIAGLLYHAESESVFYRFQDAEFLFKKGEPKSAQWIDVLGEGQNALIKANRQLGLNLSESQLNDLLEILQTLKRNPTDVECVTFSKFILKKDGSEFFNAKFLMDGSLKTQSLISTIENTVHLNPRGILSAYKEPTAIIEESEVNVFYSDQKTKRYGKRFESVAMVLSSNLSYQHLTIGMDQELGMLIATGRGAKPKVGMIGFNVSHLRLPGFNQPWEAPYGKPKEMISPLDIMLEVPIRGGKFNNEFGRPNICGYFRTYEQIVPYKNRTRKVWGYHQPIIKTGGIGSIRQLQSQKSPLLTEMSVIVMGGAQRDNSEIQRRCLETIQTCTALGTENPIEAIQWVGKGGLGNTLLALSYYNKVGGVFQLRDIPMDDQSFSPIEIWCNESVEWYVVIVNPMRLETFKTIALRESCPFSVIGNIVSDPKILLQDALFQNNIIDLPMGVLFEKSRQERIECFHETETFAPIDLSKIYLEEAIFRLLRFPCIADKSFLLTITDRTVTGLVVRDQMIGPWQVPVSDCAVTASDFEGYQGEAITIGERPALAIINPAASARMAVAEAITNMVGAYIGTLSDIRLSANWIGAFQTPGEGAKLIDAVKAIGFELCPALGIAIAVNQDIRGSETVWYGEGEEKRVTPPLSVIISAYAPVMNVRHILTPLLSLDPETLLIFIDLSGGQQRLGGSALAQVFNQVGDCTPDVDDPKLLKSFFSVIQQLHVEGKILAYHDRSDGGLFVTLCEMAFASHIGLQIDITELGSNPKSILFNEELGAVIQIRAEDVESVLAELGSEGVPNSYVIGTLDEADQISFIFNEEVICSYARIVLQQTWSETSFHLQALRDNPRCAKKQFEAIGNRADPGLNVELTFDPSEDITLPFINVGVRPRIAILREQGTHGQLEMAAAFDRANFECVDVHMNDLQNNTRSLAEFKGLAVCGGFSFGDVLGAGLGWAKRILFNPLLRDQFESFFARQDIFTLGLSNGCQMLAGLKSIIPGTKLWPNFTQNYSEQFEARLCLVEIQPSVAVLLQGMEGSRLLVPVAHKEGRVVFENEIAEDEIIKQGLVALRYVDNWGRKTKIYPANPNGSQLGMTGFTNTDGRVLCMMPHPDRVFRTIQHSWHPDTWGEDAPWLRMFRNARQWVG